MIWTNFCLNKEMIERFKNRRKKCFGQIRDRLYRKFRQFPCPTLEEKFKAFSKEIPPQSTYCASGPKSPID